MHRKCVISVSGGLGDMFMLLPLFRRFEGFLVLSDLYKEVFEPYELDIIWWEEQKSMIYNLIKISKILRIRKPEIVYGTYPNGRRINLLIALSPGLKVFCDDGNFPVKRLITFLKLMPGAYPIKIPFPIKKSYAEINSKILGIKYSSCVPFDFKENPDFREEAEKFARKNPYVVIHPTSKYKHRSWSIDGFIEVSKFILKNGYSVVFVLGKEDKATKDLIENRIPDAKILFGRSINLVISYVRRAKFVFANDSAIAQIGGIAGVKTFVIYGYTRYYHTAPYGSCVIRVPLSCSPCYNFAKGEEAVAKECRFDFACLKKITTKMVIDYLVECKAI